MEKYKLLEKAYKVDFSKIDEGYLYSEQVVHAESRNKAKYLLLGEYKYENLVLKYSNNEITYSNIPIIRCPNADIFEFEGNRKKLYEINQMLEQRKRNEKFDEMLNDSSIKYCYITKRGQYYAPNNCGYTDYKINAGVYTKEDAIGSAKSCNELNIIPINIDEHNKILQDKIDDLKSRLIK